MTPPLTRKRRRWAKQRGEHTFRGAALHYSAPLELRYRHALTRLVREMTEATKREVAAMWRETHPGTFDASEASQARILMNSLMRRFSVRFGRRALTLAEMLAKGAEKASSAGLNYSLKELTGGLTLKTTVVTGKVEEIVKAVTAENVALIKSIPEQYLLQVQGSVMRSITTGAGLSDLLREIQRHDGVTERRAELIARDQTSKATTAINSARMEVLGIKKFQWLHSGGGQHPRKLHQRLSGQIFSLDDPPVIDERTGERGLPGQLINCRCRMVPVIEFGGDDGE